MYNRNSIHIKKSENTPVLKSECDDNLVTTDNRINKIASNESSEVKTTSSNEKSEVVKVVKRLTRYLDILFKLLCLLIFCKQGRCYVFRCHLVAFV